MRLAHTFAIDHIDTGWDHLEAAIRDAMPARRIFTHGSDGLFHPDLGGDHTGPRVSRPLGRGRTRSAQHRTPVRVCSETMDDEPSPAYLLPTTQEKERHTMKRNARARRVALALVSVTAGITATTTDLVAAPAHAAVSYTPTSAGSLIHLSGNTSFTVIEAAQTVTCGSASLGGYIVNNGTRRTYGTTGAYLPTVSATGCTAPLSTLTSVAGTSVGTPVFAVTGDPTGSSWPAVIKDTGFTFSMSGCNFTAKGRIVGRYDTSIQRFTSNSGGSGLTVDSAGNGIPTGPLCATLDIQPGDSIRVDTYLDNSPAMSLTSP